MSMESGFRSQINLPLYDFRKSYSSSVFTGDKDEIKL